MSVRSDVGVCVRCGRVELRSRMAQLDAEHRYRCAVCATPWRSPHPEAAAELAARIASADRLIVAFVAEWSSFSREFLPLIERADTESSVPMARADLAHPMDPRWDEHRIHTIPTAIYFEHGEELERVEAMRGRGMNARAFERFVDDVEALQERMIKRHGRMQVDRFG